MGSDREFSPLKLHIWPAKSFTILSLVETHVHPIVCTIPYHSTISQLYPHDIPNSWLDTHIKVDSLLFMDQSPQFLVVTTTLLMVKSC